MLRARNGWLAQHHYETSLRNIIMKHEHYTGVANIVFLKTLLTIFGLRWLDAPALARPHGEGGRILLDGVKASFEL